MTLSTLWRAMLPIALVAAPAIAAAPSPDLARLKSHLASVQTMTANFTQTDARGRTDSGMLQMKRPGRIRFEYAGGGVLLVANGKTPTFIHHAGGKKSNRPLSPTPHGAPPSTSPGFNRKARI